MPSPLDKWVNGELRRFTDSILDRPWRFVLPQLLLFVACLIYSWNYLGFSTARGDLVSEDIKYQRDYLEFKREFQLPDSIVAVAESESPEKNRQFIERLAAKIQAEPQLFANTFYKGDLKQMGRKGLLFLSQDSLDQVSEVIRQDWTYIEPYSNATNLNSALRSLNRDFRDGIPSEAGAKDLAKATPAFKVFQRTLEQAGNSIVDPQTNRFAGLPSVFGEANRLYLTFSEGRMYALVTHAAQPSVEDKAVSRLWEIVRQTRHEISGVNAGITGEPVLNHDEMHEASRDINLATAISFLLVALVFIVGFHEVRRPLIATFCLLVGIVFALGFTTLTVGRLNIISVTLVPILVGVAVDFGVHFISRYEEELSKGRTRREALRRAFVFTGLGIITSGFTIAGAFFAMMLTDFKGIKEMGFVSGSGMLLCLLPMLTLLPLLLARGDRVRRGPAKPRVVCTKPACIEQIWLRRPKLLLFTAAAFTVFCVAHYPLLRFDYNLLNLQSDNLPAVQVEQKLIEASSQSLLYGVVMTDSLEEARTMQAKLEKLWPVASVTSMVNYLGDDQTAKLERIREIQRRAALLKLPPVDKRPVNLSELNETLYALQGYLGWAPYFLPKDAAGVSAAAEIEAFRNSVIKFRTMILSGDPKIVARLTAFQQAIFRNLHDTIGSVRDQDTRFGLTLADVPPFLRERFISPSGKYLLQVNPRADLWQRSNQEDFLKAVRTVAPNVTGTVVQIHEYTALLKDNFVNATGYAGLIIAGILLLQFRRFSSVLLACVPVALGLCWTIGMMGYLDMPFNPVNIMALTLLTGIGVSNGIHILVRFAEDARPTILTKSTGKAIVVSALTTMAGFGSLMVAKHQGIASLGAVMAIGTLLCMLASITVVPALLIVLSKKTEAHLKPAEPIGVINFDYVGPRSSLRPVFETQFPIGQIHANFKSQDQRFPENWS